MVEEQDEQIILIEEKVRYFCVFDTEQSLVKANHVM